MTTTTTAVPTDPVKIIMADRLADVGTEQTLRTIAQEMAAGEIGVLIVRAATGPVGLVSERDIVTALATGGNLDTQQAVDIMAIDLVTAEPTDSIASVGRLMLEAGVRHVVIRAGDTVVGLVSIRDVLAVLLGSLVDLPTPKPVAAGTDGAAQRQSTPAWAAGEAGADSLPRHVFHRWPL